MTIPSQKALSDAPAHIVHNPFRQREPKAPIVRANFNAATLFANNAVGKRENLCEHKWGKRLLLVFYHTTAEHVVPLNGLRGRLLCLCPLRNGRSVPITVRRQRKAAGNRRQDRRCSGAGTRCSAAHLALIDGHSRSCALGGRLEADALPKGPAG